MRRPCPRSGRNGCWRPACRPWNPASSVTLEHFYLTLQAALDGLGVAIGPERLVAEDVAAGRLAMPFAGPAAGPELLHLCPRGTAARPGRAGVLRLAARGGRGGKPGGTNEGEADTGSSDIPAPARSLHRAGPEAHRWS